MHSQAVPAAVEVELAGAGGGHGRTCCSRAASDGVAGAPRRVRTLLGDGTTASDDPPAGGAAYPWDPWPRGDDRATALKLTFALSGLADVLAAAARGRRAPCAARPAPGVLYAALPRRHPAGRTCAAPSTGSRAVCTGTAAAPSSSTPRPRSRPRVDVWGPVPALDLMRRVKDQFDPDHRLAPGRFVGGI